MPIEKKYGNRSEVWNGIAMMTRGGLKSEHLMINKKGKLISKKQHARGKMLLEKYCKNQHSSGNAEMKQASNVFSGDPSGSNQAKRLMGTANSIQQDIESELGIKFDERMLDLPAFNKKKVKKKASKPKRRIAPQLIQ
jgi:hypothetical protein